MVADLNTLVPATESKFKDMCGSAAKELGPNCARA